MNPYRCATWLNGPAGRSVNAYGRRCTQGIPVLGLAAVVLVACGLGGRALGQCEDAKLTPSDGAGQDEFGLTVSISGDAVLIGSWLDDDNGADSGSAYVYRFGGSQWVEQPKLTASDGQPGDRFGVVSIDGNVAVVGASFDDHAVPSVLTDAGSAYIFRFNGAAWIEEQKFIPSDADDFDRFGVRVSVSGDVAVITAVLDDDAGSASGSAYVFRFNGANWIEEQKLTASDAEAGDQFGSSVSTTGDVVVIGAHLDDHPGSLTDAGSAYVFRYDPVAAIWNQEQKLTASDAEAGDQFGSSVSTTGDVVVIGAHLDDHPGSLDEAGSAYVFRFNGTTWIEEQKLTASDASFNDRFGFSLSVNGDVVLIGAPLDHNGPVSQAGSAYVFRFNGANWIEEQKLPNPDPGPASDDQFGYSVALGAGGVALVGVRWDDPGGVGNAGSAYLYRFDGTTWNQVDRFIASDPATADNFGSSVSLSGNRAVVGAPE